MKPVIKIEKPLDLAPFIDHTLLKADATSDQVKLLCQEALKYGFYAVCLNSRWIPLAKELLQNSAVKIAAVVGFPLGAQATEVKSCETKFCINSGASEIDMVIDVGSLKKRQLETVENDIHQVVAAAKDKVVKVIIETGLLTYDEKLLACQLSVNAGAHFVKTSTGFGPGGATVADIQLMRETVGPNVGVKASGGIRSFLQAKSLIEAGANRLGLSSSVSIVSGKTGSTGY